MVPDVMCEDLPVTLDRPFLTVEVSLAFPGVFLSLVVLFPLMVPAAGDASPSPQFSILSLLRSLLPTNILVSWVWV